MFVAGMPRAAFLVQFHPPAWTACRHWRANLQATNLAALAAAHRDRQSALAVAVADHRGETQNCPAVTPGAVAGQFMLVLVQARDAAEVDHEVSVSGRRAHRVSLRRATFGKP